MNLQFNVLTGYVEVEILLDGCSFFLLWKLFSRRFSWSFLAFLASNLIVMFSIYFR